MAEKVRRRLTTILCADVQSYTHLMETDEAGTLATLKRYRSAMAAVVERHDGRVVNTWGDAVLAEFQSVIEAVQCAVEVQQELSTLNGELPTGRRMWFRIGINLGDVMVEGDDIYGEGVNVAARLQEIAEPGGIAISRAVYEQVRNKLTIAFDFIGDQPVKNVSDPVASYRIVLDRRNAPSIDPESDGEDDEPAFVKAVPDVRSLDWGELRTLFLSLPRALRRALAFAGFMFVLNLLTGIQDMWFLWFAAPVLFIAGYHLVTRQRRSPE